MSYGKITVGFGSAEQRELEIKNFVQGEYKDHRVITIAAIEDGTYCLSVDNPQSTGRNSTTSMWLSKESLIGLIATMHMYFAATKEDISTSLKDAAQSKDINYHFSDNLSEITELIGPHD